MTIGELVKKLSLYLPHLNVVCFREGELRDISQVFKVPGKIDRTGKELEDPVIYIAVK
ncbi:MAG: hypothetical protein KGI54_07610 [Pseudomonadota bacterium]|nr:hypothetical protein [Pseudomonadota bacterium]